jgi:hypothetical protein
MIDLRPILYPNLGKPTLQAFTISGKTWGVPEGTLCIEYKPKGLGANGPESASWCRMLII